MLKNQHKILFVDDELENLRLAEKAFRQHTVLMADSTAEAFQILSQHEISLVISDQHMPAMTGIEFLQQVSTRWPHTIRFLLTGLIDLEEVQQALNSDLIYGYFVKPYKILDFRITLTRALEYYELYQENLKLRQDWQQTTKETSALLQAGSALKSGTDASAVLDRIVNLVCQDFGYQACALELIDKNSWQLYIKASAGFPMEAKELRTPIENDDIVSYVARTGKLTYLPDVSKDSRYVVVNAETKSQLVIPLRLGDEIIGVLNIESTKLNAFSDRDLLILTSFADKAAAIVQQAYLFELVSRGKAEWETTFDAISDAIFIFDRKRRLRRVNRAGANLLNRSYDQLLGDYCCNLFPDEQKEGCLTKTVLNNGEPASAHYQLGDAKMSFLFNADPIRDEKRQIIGCAVTVRAKN